MIQILRNLRDRKHGFQRSKIVENPIDVVLSVFGIILELVGLGNEFQKELYYIRTHDFCFLTILRCLLEIMELCPITFGFKDMCRCFG